MDEVGFEKFLVLDKQIVSKDKAVRSRITKARMIEKKFKCSLDDIVNNDEHMFSILIKIKLEFNDANGAISNALRKYYIFRNDKTFPLLSHFR